MADAAGADRFRLFGASQGGQLAAMIAARYPGRVEALVLYGMCASGTVLLPAEVRKSVVALVPAHWGLGLKALAGAFVTDPTAEDMAAFTRFERASVSAAVAIELLEVYYDTGIRVLLPAVRARTAVLHRVADRGTRFELGREAAALIPGAIVIPLVGPSHLLLPRRLARGPGRGAQFLVRAHQHGAAADRTRARGGRTGRRGADQSAIARRLSVAPRTAEAHVENIWRKLEVRLRAQTAEWVSEHRLRR